MIKKLQIKFVVINMTIVALLLSVILSLVYYFTEVQLENQSVRMMQNVALDPMRLKSSIAHQDEGVRLPYFAVMLSPEGKRMSMGGGYYDLSDEKLLDDLVRMTALEDKRSGVIPKYNLRYCFVNNPRSKYIVFADMSSEKATLRSLTETCTFIGVTGFLLFLAGSILLSKWAVSPVDKALKSQKKFVADASHELKTPLAVIMTNAQLIEEGESNALNKKAASNITTVSLRMKSLIEDMLTLAKNEREEGRKVFSKVDFSKVCSDASLPFEPLFFEEGHELIVDIEENIFVKGDKEKLLQVAGIFLDNAAKYTSPRGRVWLTLKSEGKKKCVLSVADEGEEIPEDKLSAIFGRFYRLDESRTDAGSFGLGLSIADSIAKEHGGRVWAQSKNNINTFSLELKIL